MKKELRDIFKDSYSKLFASLYSRFNDIELVEDGIQDALEKAMVKWEYLPKDPLAWLYVTARNRILDLLKRESSRNIEFSEEYLGGETEDFEIDSLDEQLRLMCFCCHPALAERVQILLTLKLVAGLTTGEISAALVMKPKSVSQALTRARSKIRIAGIPFDTPDHTHLAERIEAVRKTVYLMFNEGYYSNSQHSLYRIDLCNESIRLTRLLCATDDTDRDSSSLLALLLFQNSRADARSTSSGEPVLLENQNRKLWNKGMINEAGAIFEKVLNSSGYSPSWYFYQAAIAREYSVVSSFSESDWDKICRIYAAYYYEKPDPIVLLSWITAESFRTDAATALALMESSQLERYLLEYRWFYSSRAELRVKVGDFLSALEDLSKSLSITQNPGERRYLERRVREITEMVNASDGLE